MYFIETILPLPLANSFTYQLTKAEFDYVEVGYRVAVPFGKNKIYTALVVSKHQQAPLQYEAKEIHQIIDEKPILSEIQLKFWGWIASYYLCSIGDVYRMAVPKSLILESETLIKLKTDLSINTASLSDKEYLVFEAFQKQNLLSVTEISKMLDSKNILPVLKSMMDKALIQVEEQVYETYKPKLEKYIRINQAYINDNGLQQILELTSSAPKQKQLVLAYFKIKSTDQSADVSFKQLLEVAQTTATVAKTVVDKGIFDVYYLQQDRLENKHDTFESDLHFSPPQQTAYDQIKKSWENKDVCLLHGVTASGKTYVYIQLVRDYVAQGKQVLFLVPETVLSNQTEILFRHYFEKDVQIYNPKFNANERVEIWNSVKNNKAKVIIGTRTALFLPFQNLGLIIVDEEHDSNYKQSHQSPRFHTRDAATVLAYMFGAKVLLGTATPSIESYYNAQTNKYGLVDLKERFNTAPEPEIIMIDLKEKHKRHQMNGLFSHDLIEKINQTIAKKEQVMLFQNRRGYSPILECNSCGHIPQCTQCNVSLTYHKNKNQLQCHYCGFSIVKASQCQVCKSTDVVTKGFGTEQIELEAKELFPESRITRMDRDTTKGKFAFEKILENLNKGEVDILIGTQMLAKGLDVSNITLVGILNTDSMLYYPDFRSYEKTFQTLAQVSGRSGRKIKTGEVVFQTYNPKHTVLKQIQNNDYLHFYEQQIIERKDFKYPPFYKLVKITLTHKDYELLKQASMWYYDMLTQNMSTSVFGPEEPSINRIKNQYIRVIQIKISPKINGSKIKEVVSKVNKSFLSIPQYKSIRTIIDVDYQ